MGMALAPDDRCGARNRNRNRDAERRPPAGGDELTLSPAGRALLDALREDERFRGLITDPFGEDGVAG
jgi:hypothetical protein